MDLVEVVRVIRYVGPRDWVERTIDKSIQGTKVVSEDKQIIAETLGTPRIIGEVDSKVTFYKDLFVEY